MMYMNETFANVPVETIEIKAAYTTNHAIVINTCLSCLRITLVAVDRDVRWLSLNERF